MDLDIWRCSASRPWQLEKTHDNLLKHVKFSGEVQLHLIESVLVRDLSEKCIEFGKAHGYKVHVIDPAKGQGYAWNEAIHHVVTTRYSLKMDDDFMPVRDLPIDDCVEIMNSFPHINQICFNKRETMASKAYNFRGEPREWPKEQRYFNGDNGKTVPLVVKERWWFGSAIWRMSFIKPIFKYWPHNTHNMFNDFVILPMAGAVPNERVATPKDIENKIGCYIYGKTGDPLMCQHTGVNDSIWNGSFQKMMAEQGKEIVGK